MDGLDRNKDLRISQALLYGNLYIKGCKRGDLDPTDLDLGGSIQWPELLMGWRAWPCLSRHRTGRGGSTPAVHQVSRAGLSTSHIQHIYSTGIPDIKTLTILCIDFYKWMTIYLCYLGEVDTVLALAAQVCPRLNSLSVWILDYHLRISMFGAGRDAEGSRVGGRKRDTGHCDPSSPGVGDQVVTPVNRIKAM